MSFGPIGDFTELGTKLRKGKARITELETALREVRDIAAKDAPNAGDGTIPNEEPWFTFWSIATAALEGSA